MNRIVRVGRQRPMVEQQNHTRADRGNQGSWETIRVSKSTTILSKLAPIRASNLPDPASRQLESQSKADVDRNASLAPKCFWQDREETQSEKEIMKKKWAKNLKGMQKIM